MQGIWAAIVAVALLIGRQRGLALAPLAVAGGAHGAQLVSPGNFAAGRDEPHVHRPGGPGGALPNYRTYRCADGQWLFLGGLHQRLHRARADRRRRRMDLRGSARGREPGEPAASGRT